jgi:hypothetical protein
MKLHPAEVLNRLLPALYRSLTMYLVQAQPWAGPDHRQFLEVLKRLADDDAAYSQRLVAAIVAHGQLPLPGVFATEFTDLNDLSAEYLLEVLIAESRNTISLARCLLSELSPGSADRELVEEILGNLQGHFEILEELRGGQKRKAESGL